MEEFKVHFKPQNKSIRVPKGTDLLTAAIKAGVVIAAACGGEGLCGKCKVLIAGTTVLACQTLVESDLLVEVPKGSVESHEAMKHESEDFTKGIISEREKSLKLSPIIRKVYVELSKPTQDDNTDDLERVLRAVEAKIVHARIFTRLSNIKHLSENLRDSVYKVTAVIAYEEGSIEMLALEPGDTTDRLFAFAFDIGTTTVAGQLIDLNSGEILNAHNICIKSKGVDDFKRSGLIEYNRYY
ncbi:MAG: 2Fe-2S iron-sulfur cluster-binding protein [Candidatus Omnitrophica bacterium]|nr:2Fe-2S iron-sulfur cluster-binding protein [Candidatus Omnitrophota bacterium]